MNDPLRTIWRIIHTYYPTSGVTPAHTAIDFLYREPTVESMKPSISILRVEQSPTKENVLDTTSKPDMSVDDPIDILVVVPVTQGLQDETVIDYRWVMMTQIREIIREHAATLKTEGIANMHLSRWAMSNFTGGGKPREQLRARARLQSEYDY